MRTDGKEASPGPRKTSLGGGGGGDSTPERPDLCFSDFQDVERLYRYLVLRHAALDLGGP